MLGLARRLRRVGRLTEPIPATPSAPSPDLQTGPEAPAPSPADSLPRCLRGSVQVRHVDVGSCNGCEIEIAAAFGPVYDAERFGARLVASPRHADLLLVTGAVTRNLAGPLRRTHQAVPRPAVVVAVGDCARDGGVFAGGYGVQGSVADVVPVDLSVPGCPPRPEAIVTALRTVTGR